MNVAGSMSSWVSSVSTRSWMARALATRSSPPACLWAASNAPDVPSASVAYARARIMACGLRGYFVAAPRMWASSFSFSAQ